MSEKVAYFPLGGGLDLTTPAIAAKPGTARAALNYESDLPGYRRLSGYERFDGQVSPTDAPYSQLNFNTGTAAFALGDTVTGATSGATGKVLATGVVTSGSYGGGNAVGYVGLGAVTGNFTNAENLQVSAVTRAKAVGTQVQGASPDDATATAWQNQATANARALIAAVPGSGDVRGVWYYNNNVYAFRDNGGSGAMYKSSAAGWVAVALGYTIAFTSGGTYEIQENDVITGATSGATATVKRVVITSGSLTAGTAVGYVVVNSATGTFQAEDLNVGANLNVATIAGDKVATTLPAGGEYHFCNYNFFGSSATLRMYGCNEVGKAFEFDGTTFVPISTGMATDTPIRIVAHKKHLFLAFPGGSVQNSSLGDPLTWNAITGAAEIAVGDEVTDFQSAAPQSLIILAKNSVCSLYGNDSSDWQLETLTNEAGGLSHTAEKIGPVIYMDNRGIRSISTTPAYGDFNLGTMTQMISPLLHTKLNSGQNPVASCRVRARDIYRVFFADGTGISVYMGKKFPEVMPIDLNIPITCAVSAETANAVEKIWFGSTNGFVYQMDKGRSFDGGSVNYHLRLPFNHHGMPHTVKRWHKAVVEYDATGNATLTLTGEVNYADPAEPAMATQNMPLFGGGGYWDTATWDQFYWSAPVDGQEKVYIDGVGQSMSLLLGGEASNEDPHTLQGLTLFYSVRGMIR